MKASEKMICSMTNKTRLVYENEGEYMQQRGARGGIESKSGQIVQTNTQTSDFRLSEPRLNERTNSRPEKKAQVSMAKEPTSTHPSHAPSPR
jgi:hypothetical protein